MLLASDFSSFIPRVLHVLFSTFYKYFPMHRRNNTRYEHVTKCLPGTKHMPHPKQTLPTTPMQNGLNLLTQLCWTSMRSSFILVVCLFLFYYYILVIYLFIISGKTHTMVGRDEKEQALGLIPCALSWLFKLIADQKQK